MKITTLVASAFLAIVPSGASACWYWSAPGCQTRMLQPEFEIAEDRIEAAEARIRALERSRPAGMAEPHLDDLARAIEARGEAVWQKECPLGLTADKTACWHPSGPRGR